MSAETEREPEPVRIEVHYDPRRRLFVAQGGNATETGRSAVEAFERLSALLRPPR
ncbi:MAG TPA: hypothetical protein VNK94_07310 [Gaiellaceae bacterium]|nr:hypothetical protein [Gaiellaceae bacterium]